MEPTTIEYVPARRPGDISRRFLVLCYALAIGLAVVLETFTASEAAPFIGASSLVTTADQAQIENWLGSGPVDLTNIFTKQTGFTASDFHSAVDGKRPTITVLAVTLRAGAKSCSAATTSSRRRRSSVSRFWSPSVQRGRPPVEADMQRRFKVTAPSIHQMVITLERNGLIKREPGAPRSIENHARSWDSANLTLHQAYRQILCAEVVVVFPWPARREVFDIQDKYIFNKSQADFRIMLAYRLFEMSQLPLERGKILSKLRAVTGN
jgi:hypothetical protein